VNEDKPLGLLLHQLISQIFDGTILVYNEAKLWSTSLS